MFATSKQKIDISQMRLQALDEQANVYQRSLDERRGTIVEIFAALQRIGRQPPPALLVRPEDALKALRTAIMLGAVVPKMRAEAEAIAGDLADLGRVRKNIAARHQELSGNRDQLAREQLRLSMLIEERQRKQATVQQALEAEQQRAIELAQRVGSLKDLIGKLEQGLDSAAGGAGRQSRHRGRRDTAEPSGFGRSRPFGAGRGVSATRGQLRLPVNGVPIHRFGEFDGAGGTQKGLSIQARAGAQITSPCDGWVVYAGPFRSYGQVLILNVGGGYHVLLAGMERISVDLGQFVLTGEPVAVMGDGAQLPAAVITRPKQPVLYVEFRKDGAPIDPSPWWATNASEKVRG